MSSAWDNVTNYFARIAACPRHNLVPIPREEQIRRQTYKPFECTNCHWLAETGERMAYEQGVRHGLAQAGDTLPADPDATTEHVEG